MSVVISSGSFNAKNSRNFKVSTCREGIEYSWHVREIEKGSITTIS